MAEKKSVWLWVGIGCLGIVIVGVLAVVGLGLWAYRGAKQLEAEMKDPGLRAQKVLKVLNADALPEGYHPMVAFSIPLLMEVAILTDEAPDASGKVESFGDWGFIYFKFITGGKKDAQLRAYFAGESDDPGILRDNNINIDVDEVIGRGVIQLEGETLMYVSQRGRIQTQGYRSDEGISSVIMIDCPDDKRLRMAIWFGPDPGPGQQIDQVDFSGTPADEAAITDMMDDFRFCS